MLLYMRLVYTDTRLHGSVSLFSSVRQILGMQYMKTSLSEFITDNQSTVSFLSKTKPASKLSVRGSSPLPARFVH